MGETEPLSAKQVEKGPSAIAPVVQQSVLETPGQQNVAIVASAGADRKSGKEKKSKKKRKNVSDGSVPAGTPADVLATARDEIEPTQANLAIENQAVQPAQPEKVADKQA